MARKTTRRKRKKSAKITSKNITKKYVVSCSFLLILFISVISLSYYLFGFSLFKMGINNNTLNNISFNDVFDSDTILINNIKKMDDKKGKKIKPIELNIDGDVENLEYEVLLVPINFNVDLNMINFYITDNDDNFIKLDNLGNTNLSNDYSGNVIYSGVLKNKNDNLKLRVWINDIYDGDINNDSFEVKVKLK